MPSRFSQPDKSGSGSFGQDQGPCGPDRRGAVHTSEIGIFDSVEIEDDPTEYIDIYEAVEVCADVPVAPVNGFRGEIEILIEADVVDTIRVAPVFISAYAEPPRIVVGDSSIIHFEVDGADAVDFIDGSTTTNVTGRTTVTVNPTETTTYRLEASNSLGTTQREITVTVVEPASITSFTADRTVITRGEDVTFTWAVEDAERVEINDVTLTGNSQTYTPTATTTYNFVARSIAGDATASVTVRVVDAPAITSFTASPRLISRGGTSTLMWAVNDATTRVTLDEGIGVVTGNTHDVTPTATTTYVLMATNDAGRSVQSIVEIRVVSLPVINYFRVNPARIAINGFAVLEWDTDNAVAEDISGIGNVRGLTQRRVQLAETTTYTLTATNAAGDEVTRDVTVNVAPVPTISSFTVSQASIFRGGQTTLIWTTTDADSASIDQGVGDVAVSGNVNVRPETTTTYTLTATSLSGSVTETVQVMVTGPPTINSFTVDDALVNNGDQVTLSWSIDGADTLSIDNSVGTVTGTSVTVTPPDSATTTYTLTATNGAGSVTATTSVRAVALPVITSFTAAQSPLSVGSSTTLNWTATGATSLSIDQGIGTVTGTSVSISPTETTTYTLTATNDAGSTATESVTVTVVAVPVINSFIVRPARIALNGTATLEWRTTDATSLSIDQGVGTVTGTSTTVTPAATTTYTLTATNDAGTAVTRSVTLAVAPVPTITSFTTTSTRVFRGSQATLSWSTTGADTVSMDQGVGILPAIGNVNVRPEVPTTYTLTARSLSGTVTATVTIEVVGSPLISSFTTDDSLVTDGTQITLSWSVDDATTISIDNEIGTVTGTTHTLTPPAGETTTYTLTATNAAGTVTATTTVRSVPAPTITSFEAAEDTISTGGSTTLSWATTGATSLSISGIGDVTGTSLSVTPTATTTYTLTATNDAGAEVTETATVTVVDVPVITSFTASPTRIAAGANVTLRWVTSGATTHSIDQGIGTVTGAVHRLRVNATTTYTLTATNDAGSSTTATATVTVVPAPAINSFTASAATIFVGSQVTLRWQTTNAETVSINQGVGSVAVDGSVDVRPTSSTTYTLEARSVGGVRAASVRVTVRPLPNAPTISSFSADNAIVDNGESVTLSWSVTGADSLSIDNGIGTVTGTSVTVTPPNNTGTTYTLTATNPGGDVTATTTVRAVALPTITSLTVSDTPISVGSSTTLNWATTGAATTSIDNSVGPITGTSVNVTPSSTTTYTLTATNLAGTSVTRSITVIVVALPAITRFRSSRTLVAPGASFTLSWAVTGATSLSLDNGIGTVTGNSHTLTAPSTVTSDTSRIYTLTATNAAGDSVHGRVTVTFVNLPEITSFTVDSATIERGSQTTLNWATTDVTSVSISAGSTVVHIARGSRARAGTFDITPTDTTVYTATATGRVGGTVSQTLTVTVTVDLPIIRSFSAAPTVVNNGGSTTLSWSVDEADTISIDNSVGTVTGTSVSVTPPDDATTTYTLTATNDGGTVTATTSVRAVALPVITSFTAAQSPLSVGSSTTLNWATTGATSLSINQGIGTVTGTSRSITPARTTTYILTATNDAGSSVTESVTVTVVALPSVTTFTVDNARVTAGTSVRLSWLVENATSTSIAPGIGTVTGNTRNVTVNATTTFTLTATNAAGSTATATVTVTVVVAPAITTFTSSSSSIRRGSQATLSWAVTGSNSTTLTGGGVSETFTGAAANSGTFDVRPMPDHLSVTYTLTATNEAGTATETVTIAVEAELPTVTSFSADETVVTNGTSITLTWAGLPGAGDRNLTASIDNGIGAVTPATGGTVSVIPPDDVSTTYTLTLTNSRGSVTATAVVRAIPAPTITFTANKYYVFVDEDPAVIVTWNITGTTDPPGTRVLIDTIGGTSNIEATQTGQEYAITGPITLTIVATNAAGTEVRLARTFGVVQRPALESFTIRDFRGLSRRFIMPGNAYTLRMELGMNTRVDTVAVTHPNVAIDGSPFTKEDSDVFYIDRAFWPPRDLSTYIGEVPDDAGGYIAPFTATPSNVAGVGDAVTTQSCFIFTRPPRINSFTADSTTVTRGSAITLRWNVDRMVPAEFAGSGQVSITGRSSPSLQPPVGSATITPVYLPGDTSFTYTLRAPNVNRPVDSPTQDVVITIVDATPAPTIDFFTATPSTITTSGGTSNLSWCVTGAPTSISINNGVGEQISQGTVGNIDVTPTETTTYTLTATNAGGSVTQDVTVTVDVPPVITFTASPETVGTGETSTLTWNVTGATAVRIDQGIGAVTASGTRAVTVTADTTYTLTATNAAGTSTTATVMVNFQGPPDIHEFNLQFRAIQTGNLGENFVPPVNGFLATFSVRNVPDGATYNGDLEVLNQVTFSRTIIPLTQAQIDAGRWVIHYGNIGFFSVDFNFYVNTRQVARRSRTIRIGT